MNISPFTAGNFCFQRKTQPESIARYLLVIMKEPDNDDYIYIVEVLNTCESDHKVRWVIRFVGLLTTLYEVSMSHPGAPVISFKGETFQVKDNTVIASNKQLLNVMKTMGVGDSSKEKDVMLKKGADVLLKFGNIGIEGEENLIYTGNLMKIFNRNGVAHDK